MSDHKAVPLGERHPPIQFEYADETARLAATDFITDDIASFVRQLDNNTIWMLIGIGPAVWVQVGGSGGGGDLQTPWLSDIDGAEFDLGNVGLITAQDFAQLGLNLYTPTITAQEGSGTIGTNVRGMATKGNFLFVGTGSTLRVLDTRNPADPYLAGLVGGSGDIYGVAVAGDLLVTAVQGASNGIRIFNIENEINNPVTKGFLSLGGTPIGVRVVGSLAYVVNELSSQGLQVVDISDQNNPKLLGTFATADIPRPQFDIQRHRAYLPLQGGSSGGTDFNFQIVDISDPTSMTATQEKDLDAEIHAVFLEGRYAFIVGSHDPQIKLYDTTVNAVTFTLSLGAGVDLNTVQVSGGFLYATDNANGTFVIADVRNDLSLSVLSTPVVTGTDPQVFAIIGKHSFVGDPTDDTLTVLDLSGAEFQNLVAGNAFIGNLNARRDILAGGVVVGEALTAGKGGVLSEGPVASKSMFVLEDIVAAEIKSSTGNLPVLGFLKMDDTDLLAWRNVADDNDNAIGFVSDDFDVVFDGVIRYSFTDAHLNLTGRNLFDTGVALFGTSMAPAITARAIWADDFEMLFNVPTGDTYEFRINGATVFEIVSNAIDLNNRAIQGVNEIINPDAVVTDVGFIFVGSDGELITWDRVDTAESNHIGFKGDAFTLFFNGAGVPNQQYAFAENQADFKGNDLINVGNTAGNSAASLLNGLVPIYEEADYPGTATEIQLAVGIVYEQYNPIVTTRTIKHPASGGVFSPATIRAAHGTKETNTLTFDQGMTEPCFSTQNGQGQLVLQNLIITNDALNNVPVFDVQGAGQTALLTELDDTVVNDNSLEASKIERCIFNVNNESFLNLNQTMSVRGCEVNALNSFAANLDGNSFLPGFEFRYIDDASTIPNIIVFRNMKLSAHDDEAFFLIHVNQPTGTSLLFDGVTKSPFANNGGGFYGADNDSVSQMSDSLVNPGTHTRVHSSGHSVLEGDIVTTSTFSHAPYNGVFTAVNIVEGAHFDIPVPFAATGLGQWAYSSIDQTDPRLTVLNSDPSPDSKTNGVMTGGTIFLTTINTEDIFEPFDLNGTAVAGSTIERFAMTDVDTGKLTYTGLRDFEGVLIAAITGQSNNPPSSFAFRAVRNGSPLPDLIQAHVEIGDQFESVTLLTPISLVTGDKVILEVANSDNTNDIEITSVSVSIR